LKGGGRAIVSMVQSTPHPVEVRCVSWMECTVVEVVLAMQPTTTTTLVRMHPRHQRGAVRKSVQSVVTSRKREENGLAPPARADADWRRAHKRASLTLHYLLASTTVCTATATHLHPLLCCVFEATGRHTHTSARLDVLHAPWRVFQSPPTQRSTTQVVAMLTVPTC
jgi:hypothetical protein